MSDTAGQAVLDAGIAPAEVAIGRSRSGRTLLRWTIAVAAAVLAAAGALVSQGGAYKSGTGIGYSLGVAGGVLMLVLLLYPIRKRARFMSGWGPLKLWFRLHMASGILGPALVLFHSTFQTRSLNATVAVGCMLLVAASGLAGRFIYRRIHHGLYGSRATLGELQRSLERDLAAIEPLLRPMPAIAQVVGVYAQRVRHLPPGWGRRCVEFVLLGWFRWRTQRRVARLLAGRAGELPEARVRSLNRRVDATLRAMQRNAQFSAYERMFSLWHVLHVPFVYLFVFSAVVHVIAVHMY